MIHQLLWIVREWKNQIKWAFQRAIRGYDDRLFWGVDEYVSPIILAGLKHLHDRSVGYPNGLTEKKWRMLLKKMMYAFEIDHLPYTKAQIKKSQLGLTLFAIYFHDLWD
jgi:hypothetical protein